MTPNTSGAGGTSPAWLVVHIISVALINRLLTPEESANRAWLVVAQIYVLYFGNINGVLKEKKKEI